MKRKLAVILAMTLVTGLMGCGKGGETTEAVTKQEDKDAIVITDDTEAQKDSAEEEGPETTAKQDETVTKRVVTINYEYKEDDRMDDNDEVLVYVNYYRPTITIEGNENATAAIEQEFALDEEAFYINSDELEAEARAYFATEDLEETSPYSNTVSYSEKRVDSAVVSMQRQNYSNRGGIHGGTYYSALNFDVNTGKRLTMDDIVEDKEEFLEAAKASVLEICESDVYKDRLMPDYEASLDMVLQDDLWYFDYEGITFIANEYELAAYAEGTLRFTIPYDDIKGLKKEYAYEGGYQKSANLGETIDVDLDGDGTADEILFNSTSMDETEGGPTLLINGENYSQVFEENEFYFAYPYEEYVVLDIDESDNTLELAFQDYGMSDDPVTAFVRYEDGKVTFLGAICDRVSDGYIVNDGKGHLQAKERMAIFETVNVAVSYEVKDGKLVRVEQQTYPVVYTNFSSSGRTKTLLQDIVAYEQMNTDSESVVLKSGGKVSVLASDDKEWVQIMDEQNIIYYLHIVEGYMIDSDGEQIPATQVLETLILAG